MSNHPDQLNYDDFEAIVRKARMERSVAAGDAIASLISATLFGLGRAVNTVKSIASGSKSGAPGHASSARDIPAHH
jgi:hypothetical protein